MVCHFSRHILQQSLRGVIRAKVTPFPICYIGQITNKLKAKLFVIIILTRNLGVLCNTVNAQGFSSIRLSPFLHSYRDLTSRNSGDLDYVELNAQSIITTSLQNRFLGLRNHPDSRNFPWKLISRILRMW